ncbi:MAG: HAD family hydrolase [Anaerolineae bacterium]|nr:HAD family hydrolase [Anaerolineae bacterium]
MTHPIKAVFFDLDGTLRIPSPGPTAAFIHFARSLDIEIPPAAEHRVKVWAHEYWGHETLVKQDMEQYDIDGFWINYSKQLLEKVDARQDLTTRATLVRQWFDTEYKPQVACAPGAKQLLAALKQAGYIVGLISNRPQPLHDDVTQLGLNEFFDLMLAAGEIGYWKPDPKIFWHVISRFNGLRAEECLYVGDNYFADGRGAAAAGMVPVLYDPEDLYKESGYPVYRRIRHMTDVLQILSENGLRSAIGNRLFS